MPTPDGNGTAIVGDVIDFALTSDEWPGAFGFVTMRLHRGVIDGRDIYFIRTDISDDVAAREEGLVFVPRLAGLGAAGLAADAFIVENGVAAQPMVVSTEPARDDYTPAWRLHRVRWTGTARELSSVEEIRAAETAGDLTVESTDIILNAPVVKWSAGEMPVDTERTEYLGPGQLLSPPDPDRMDVTFKLHECFPESYYIVTDTDLGPMAEGMNVVHSPRLSVSPAADATGRVNVFMNGVEGTGPMGFQPSVFDSIAGDMEWSPYWDHMVYAWREGIEPRLLRTEAEIHAARDAGDLDEFPGAPPTDGEIFTVNCPVPVTGPQLTR